MTAQLVSPTYLRVYTGPRYTISKTHAALPEEDLSTACGKPITRKGSEHFVTNDNACKFCEKKVAAAGATGERRNCTNCGEPMDRYATKRWEISSDKPPEYFCSTECSQEKVGF